MKEYKVKLDYPVEYYNEKTKRTSIIEEITLERLKVKHLKVLPDNFADRGGVLSPKDIPPLIGELSGLPIDAIDEIDFADLEKMFVIIQSFLENAPQTGSK